MSLPSVDARQRKIWTAKVSLPCGCARQRWRCHPFLHGKGWFSELFYSLPSVLACPHGKDRNPNLSDKKTPGAPIRLFLTIPRAEPLSAPSRSLPRAEPPSAPPTSSSRLPPTRRAAMDLPARRRTPVLARRRPPPRTRPATPQSPPSSSSTGLGRSGPSSTLASSPLHPTSAAPLLHPSGGGSCPHFLDPSRRLRRYLFFIFFHLVLVLVLC